MKREQLLEAIGGVDEGLLMETEQTVRPRGRLVRRLVLAAATIAALAVTVAGATELFLGLKADNGATVANLATGMGTFIYSEDSIFYGTAGKIVQYDTAGNVLREYPLESEYVVPHYLFAMEGAIVYTDGYRGLNILPLDGSAPQKALEDTYLTYVYVDGNQLYTTNGTQMLTRIDLLTGEATDLLENVSTYYVDENYIYAVQASREYCYFRSQKGSDSFEKIPLTFDPNKVAADGETLYFCQWIEEDLREEGDPRYQVNRVSGDTVTPLPVYSWFYQLLDGCVLYREEYTYKLKSYDPSTGETKTLAENVFDFAVLEDRYICIDRFNEDILILDTAA